MMYNTLSFMMILNEVLSFKNIRSYSRFNKKSFQKFINTDEDYDVEVLKTRFILGMVDSLSNELLKSIHVELLLNNCDYDDIISNLPHQLTEELINDKSKFANNELTQEKFNSNILVENISYSLVLVPTSSIVDTSDQSIHPALLTNNLFNASCPINRIPIVSTSNIPIDTIQDTTEENPILKGVDTFLKIILRYCVPPIIMQTVPHKLPQLVLQWIHDHI